MQGQHYMLHEVEWLLQKKLKIGNVGSNSLAQKLKEFLWSFCREAGCCT